MVRMDLHTHTRYGDGNDAPEELVQTAIRRGLTVLGFSEHSPITVPHGVGMTPEGEERYIAEILSLKEKYRGRIRILLGLEQDSFSEAPSHPYDYRIGSTHLLKLGEEYVPVDHDPETLKRAAETYFGGDFLMLAEAYFREESLVLLKTGADIVGHFDLISKFNEGGRLFDPSAPRYREAWKKALDILIPYGKPFEINTGAMARGYRSAPYLTEEMTAYIRERGGTLLLSSDCHRKENLLYDFPLFAGRLREEEKRGRNLPFL